MKRILCTCSENRVRPELSISAAGQRDRGSGDENAEHAVTGHVHTTPHEFWENATITSHLGFVPISGSNHFEITKEMTEVCPSGFTAQSASMRMPEMVVPRVSRFLTAGQGERRLWERDWVCA